ncbi:DNA pilot protein [Dipodfec virus UA06Rod_5]|uniref:DNA pilot protein n=1 Tax=Dipodfec virus UA06Rod_5 TaxID=2929325 RepID=A0A976N268_9VIRU|nr:DNA pilot protein [Dipodfec virus UA06Rod_5]
MGFLDFLNPIGSAVSSIFGSVGNAISQNQTNKTNLRIARENREWQTGEREAQQQWQDQQRIAQNQFSEQMYNQYESPKAMVEQLTAAGLNPRMASDGNIGSVQASSGSSGGAPSGQSAPVPTMQPTNFAGGFQDMAAAFSALAQARKAGVDTDIAMKMFTPQFKKSIAEAKGQEFINSINSTKLKYLDAKEKGEVEEILLRIANGQVQGDILRKDLDILVNKKLIAKYEADTWYDKYRRDANYIESQTNLNNAKASAVPSEIEVNKSNSFASTMQGWLSNAQTVTANQIRDTLIENAKKEGSKLDEETLRTRAERIGSNLQNLIYSKTGSREVPQDLYNRLINIGSGILGSLTNFDPTGYNTLLEELDAAKNGGSLSHSSSTTKTLDDGNILHSKPDGSWYITNKKGKVIRSGK